MRVVPVKMMHMEKSMVVEMMYEIVQGGTVRCWVPGVMMCWVVVVKWVTVSMEMTEYKLVTVMC